MKAALLAPLAILALVIAGATATNHLALGVEPQSPAEKPTALEADNAVGKTTVADDAAIERTRETVKMLDNIYKQVIVLITDKYVHSEDDFPAGSAAVVLFDTITDSGSHKVRLLDATGDPYEADNVAKDAFEKQGIKRLKSGEAYVEEVVRIDGKPQLRAMTPVPVVMEKCVMCHAHYADVPKGEPIGAISYTLPIR